MTVKLCECGCGEPAPIATSTCASRGYVKGEPKRFRTGHHFRKTRGPHWVSEDHGYETPCLIWQGYIDPKCGYGVRGGKKTHRLAWEKANGSIPDGLFVLHKCDVRACGRPDHLFLGTLKDNTEDCVAKGRHTHGERSPKAKLREEQVREIRALYASTSVTHKALGARYGVSEYTIAALLARRSWRHVA